MDSIKTIKVHDCKKCSEKDSSKFYSNRYNICKYCYSRKITENSSKRKVNIEELQNTITELKNKIEEQNKIISALTSTR